MLSFGSTCLPLKARKSFWVLGVADKFRKGNHEGVKFGWLDNWSYMMDEPMMQGQQGLDLLNAS